MTGLELVWVVVLSIFGVLILKVVADSIVEARQWYRRLEHAPGLPVHVRVAPAGGDAAADYRQAPGDALEIEYPARVRVPVRAIRRATIIHSLGRPGDVPIDLLVLDVEPAPHPPPGAWVRDREVVIPVDADGFDAALAAVRASVEVIGSVTR